MRELWYTVGPSSLGKERELFLNGATGVRLVFSYGTHELQEEIAVSIKKAATQVGCRCSVIADLTGEKLRLGSFSGKPSIPVTQGTFVHLIRANVTKPSSNNLVLPVPCAAFFSQAKEGNIVTVGDGSTMFVVTRVSDGEVLGQIIADGMIDQSRGLIIQGNEFQPRALTSKDLRDLEYVLSTSAYDVVAVSFVASDEDVLNVRQLAQEADCDIRILAKIETAMGVENINAICQAADLVMAARGDLALAIPWVELPAAVRKIASAAKANSTPWILATQIAEGLERFVIPTRAEICDLENWLSAGCAGVLLSYETAFGSHPVNAVKCTHDLLKRWGLECTSNIGQ